MTERKAKMALLPNDSIWPDDTRRAAVTLALASATNSDMQFHDAIDSIKDALNSGRPMQFVMELIRLLTAELGEQFNDPDTAATYRQMAAEAQAYEDDIRARGEWRE
jgi:glucan phosphorylase